MPVGVSVGGDVSVEVSVAVVEGEAACVEGEIDVEVGLDAAVVCVGATPDDLEAVGDGRPAVWVADRLGARGTLPDDDGLCDGVEESESTGPGPDSGPGMMLVIPPTVGSDGHRDGPDARLRPVTVAAARAHTPISRELGTLRRHASTRCQLDKTTGRSGNSSLRTISSHWGPA